MLDAGCQNEQMTKRGVCMDRAGDARVAGSLRERRLGGVISGSGGFGHCGCPKRALGLAVNADGPRVDGPRYRTVLSSMIRGLRPVIGLMRLLEKKSAACLLAHFFWCGEREQT